MMLVKWFSMMTFVCFALVARADSLRENLRQGTAMIVENGEGTVTLDISLPEGAMLQFTLQPSEVMSPELAANFPQLRTWMGRSAELPELTVRCDQSPFGLHAQIFTPEGTVYLDQFTVNSPHSERGILAARETASGGFHCLTESRHEGSCSQKIAQDADDTFHQIRTFRLAVTVAGEYTEFHGGTVESALAAIVTVFNRVNGIYERDLGVRLLLVPGMEQLIFTNKNTDPFTSNTPTATTMQEAQETFDQILGTANYDLGILFNTGLYGLAYLGSVCDPKHKGGACMGLPEPVGEIFAIYVAHEMAHQFGASHSFNSTQGFCGPNRNAGSAVEPGTGSTLMSYAGLPCGNDSLQPLMSDYFHAETIHEIRGFLMNAACGQIITTSNKPPTVTVPSTFFVPKETPFILHATGQDPDGDTLLYCWEQMDTGPPKLLSDPDNGFSPLFRSFPPGTNAARVFPKWEALLGNAPSLGEQLPETNRLMHFRVTVRDSQNMGASAFADTHVQVVGSAGPFRITSHNTNGYFRGAEVITWDVAGTTNPPLNATLVNLLLSTNAGKTFNITLATNVPNVGTAAVMFPGISTSSARLKIEPVGQIFFDINDADFVIYDQPRFRSADASGTNLVLRWQIENGKQYQLEQATTLPGDTWTELDIVTTTFGNEMEALVPIQNVGNRFFRIREF
ncbi:MAG: hypothetical protein H0X66_11625 [Verrucomicrobia bacterium]|nr:hypothetical protein [Verrucomicrobiota bacterium]